MVVPKSSDCSSPEVEIPDGPFKNPCLIGGLEHEFYDFPFSWECHHPN